MAATGSAAPVQLQLQTIYGVRSQLESSLYFCDEHTVIYPAGNQFVLTNVETKSQRIFKCNELEHVDCIMVHPNLSVIAVVASGTNAEKLNTTISFYDLQATIGKRKRMFELRETTMTITSMAFSQDGKYLAILECGNREYTLALWQWQKSRLSATLKLGAVEGVTVLSQVLFQPTDSNLLSVVGRRFYRSIRHMDGNLRIQTTSGKLDQHDFLCHAWYDSSRFIAGTSNGHICVLFNGDIQTDIDVIDARERQITTIPRTVSVPSTTGRSAQRSALQQLQHEHLDTSRPTGEEITSITIINKGFFCLIGGRRLCLFSKIAESWDFAKTREYVIPSSDIGGARSVISYSTKSQSSSDTDQLNHGHSIWKIAVSPREEHVLVLTSRQQIYSVSDMTKDQTVESKEPFQLELIFNSYHQSSIRSLEIATQKPLFISSSDDHTVRLWNYETNVTEQLMSYSESVHAVTLHPSGHQVVVAFASKVALMNVLIDGLSTVKEYPIHAAHEVQFSHGGHLFAVLDSNIIQIISPVYLKVIHRFNHGQSIRHILWKRNDLALYSQSSNCFIIWDIENQKRFYEYKPNFRFDGGFVADREDRIVYLSCDDGYIRTFFNGPLNHMVKLPNDDKTSCLEMIPSNGALLCGTQRGSIYVIKTPLTNTSTPIYHFLAHSKRITHISVAFHEAFIMTGCEDGILMFWLTHVKPMPNSENWTTVVLQNKTRFLRLSETIEALQTEVQELKQGHEFRIQQMETTYLADLQRRTDMSVNERRLHEIQIDQQLVEKDKARKDFELKCTDMDERYNEERKRIEEADRENIRRELEKEGELIRLAQKITEENEARYKATIEANENEMRDIVEYFTGKIRETETELVALRQKTRKQAEENAIEKKNIEADVDDEHLKLILEFNNQKQIFMDEKRKLEKEFKETLEQKVHSLTLKLNEGDAAAQGTKKRIQEHTNRVQGMSEEIASLKKEINERRQTINEKVCRINDLELKNQELEKFQYVLNYKIDELQRLIKPREEEIERMKEQIHGMASEREVKQVELTKNRHDHEELKQKLHAVDTHVKQERLKRKEYENAMRHIKGDILMHFADVSDPQRLAKSVAQLYDKHVFNDNARKAYATNDNTGGISEETLAQNRQRAFLERTRADLKSRLSSDLNATRTNQMRIMNENALLIQELNSLRQELRVLRGRIQDYEVAKQTFDERGIHSIDALIQTLNADAGNYVARQRESELIKDAQKNQQEIIRLRQHLARIEAGYSSSLNDNANDASVNVSILKFT